MEIQPFFGSSRFDAPQIIVVLFLTFGRTETVIMHTHRITLAEYVTYDAALAGSIHALQNNQQTTARPFTPLAYISR